MLQKAQQRGDDAQASLVGGGARLRDIEALVAELLRRERELRDQNEALRASQTQLARARDRYRNLYESAPIGYFTLDGDQTIQEINLRGAEMLGMRREDLFGGVFADFIAEDARETYRRTLERARSASQRQECELAFERSDGSRFVGLVEVVADHPANVAAGGYRVILSDVTFHVRAEEELARSNKDLEQFASGASHDLQEPLRQIQGFLTFLRNRYQGRLDQDADDFIGYAIDGAAHMSELIRDLLDYSRLGSPNEAKLPTRCQSVLDRALDNLRCVIEETRARVTHDELPTVTAVPSQLARLFQNLLGNALKFHRDGVPPVVHVGVRRNGRLWEFSVADNGIGIAPEQCERVLGVFQRLHGVDQYPGTGMGLAFCKRIVERCGGRIWIESEVGRGSTVCFTIPV